MRPQVEGRAKIQLDAVGTSRWRLERRPAEIVEFGGVGCQGLKTEAEADGG